MSNDWRDKAAQLADLHRGLYDTLHFFVHGAAVRISTDQGLYIAVNRSSISYEEDFEGGQAERSAQEQPELVPSGYCLIDEQCEVLAPAGAVESHMSPHYVEIFRQRPDVNVISLWHGVHTDAVATRRGEIPITVEHLNAKLLDIPVADAENSPGSSWDDVREWIGKEMRKAVIDEGANAAVMTSFATMTVASNFFELKRRIRAIERSAWSVLMGTEGIPTQWAALMEPSQK